MSCRVAPSPILLRANRLSFRRGLPDPARFGWRDRRVLEGRDLPGAALFGQDPGVARVTFADAGLYLTGGTLVLDHGHGISSNFLHLSRIDAKVGDVVKQGDVIAAVGATGRVTGPHLHWGMNWFDVRIDPLLVLERPR